MVIILEAWSSCRTEHLWEEKDEEDSLWEEAMRNHASTRIDGGRRRNRRSNPEKDEGCSGGSTSGSKGGDLHRFEVEGLVFQVKVIGNQVVLDDRGNHICENTRTRLNMAVRASGDHISTVST